MIRLKLLSRPDCHLCEVMKAEVDAMLGSEPHEWEIVDIDDHPELAARYGDSIPVLFVNERLFAKVRLPNMAGLRSLHAAVSAAEEA